MVEVRRGALINNVMIQTLCSKTRIIYWEKCSRIVVGVLDVISLSTGVTWLSDGVTQISALIDLSAWGGGERWILFLIQDRSRGTHTHTQENDVSCRV